MSLRRSWPSTLFGIPLSGSMSSSVHLDSVSAHAYGPGHGRYGDEDDCWTDDIRTVNGT